MRSIVDANVDNWPLDFHVLYDVFSADARNRILASLPHGSATVEWIKVDMATFAGFTTKAYISKMTYARLLLPSLFHERISKVLYLDADILVLRNLGPLWTTDLTGSPIGAVLDNGVDSLLKQNDSRVKNVPRVQSYFNAGVLLIDLTRWRKERIAERAFEFLARYPKTPFSDQDALNAVCDGEWKQLDPRWNFQDHSKHSIAAMDRSGRPAIIHFVANEKPWDARALNVNAPFYDTFRDQTEFARSPAERLSDMLKRTWARSKTLIKTLVLGQPLGS